ncbi:MAG: hypothetical protein IKX25_09700 [Bacteroidales bacterium]|nr:hypothetical protein [Bacteroidales bacterium]
MKKVFVVVTIVCAGFGLSPSFAEEPEPSVTLSVGADVVSSYLWRGQECGGFSVQPSATVTFNKAGISIGAWASAELFEKGEDALNMTEFDLSLAWNPIEALTVGVTDYYFHTDGYFGTWNFSSCSSHTLEANLAYDFGPLALAWNTVVAGCDVGPNDDRAYSTYVEVIAPWKLGSVDGSAAVGASLWDDSFTQVDTDGFKVCNVTLIANKELFSLPFYGQVVYNPASDKIYFAVGVSF